jgi:hypothetical protein
VHHRHLSGPPHHLQLLLQAPVQPLQQQQQASQAVLHHQQQAPAGGCLLLLLLLPLMALLLLGVAVLWSTCAVEAAPLSVRCQQQQRRRQQLQLLPVQLCCQWVCCLVL